MSVLGRVGGLLRQSVLKQAESNLSSSSPSMFQAVRWMSSCRLFIGDLSYNADEWSLREAFSKYGEVYNVKVGMDRETGRPRGFGFVTYSSSEEAAIAIHAMDGKELLGRRVRVTYSTGKARTGFGDGYGYYGGSGVYGGRSFATGRDVYGGGYVGSGSNPPTQGGGNYNVAGGTDSSYSVSPGGDSVPAGGYGGGGYGGAGGTGGGYVTTDSGFASSGYGER